MQTTVKLQAPYEYSSFWVVMPILILIGTIIFFGIKFISNYMKKKKAEEENNKKEVIKPKDLTFTEIETLKGKYLDLLDELEMNLDEIGVRKAYQKLSTIIRGFVTEATNVNVNTLTLQEINPKTMPMLYALIQEYYAPEFSQNSESNLNNSILNTRKVIKQWN